MYSIHGNRHKSRRSGGDNEMCIRDRELVASEINVVNGKSTYRRGSRRSRIINALTTYNKMPVISFTCKHKKLNIST